MPTLTNMRRLWVHEVLRVFGDRLIDQDDTSWLVKQIGVTLNSRMNVLMEELFKDFLPSRKRTTSKDEVGLPSYFLLLLVNIFICLRGFSIAIQASIHYRARTSEFSVLRLW